jgi:ABC-type multidrug transport system ATPase subunit
MERKSSNKLQSDFFSKSSTYSFDTQKGMKIDVSKLCYGLYLGTNQKYFKKILNDISFRLDKGTLCALMGPSGSGKR